MGAWGYTALECDEGLSVLDCIKCYLTESFPNNDTITVSLKELMMHLCTKGYFATSSIDYCYDITAITLCELFFTQKNFFLRNSVNVKHPALDLSGRNISISRDKDSIRQLFEQISDIKNNVGDREITELWSDSEHWIKHINSLCEMLQNELIE